MILCRGHGNGATMPLRRDLPSLNALAAVEAAVRFGNFSQAARELDVAASAVSRHIAQVEQWSGLRLFERRGRHVFVTPEGQLIAESVRNGFDDIARTIERLQRERNGTTVTIACSFDVGCAWLMPRYSRLQEQLANADIRIVTATTWTYTEFDTPDVDISIRFGDGKWANYESVKLYEECAYPVVGKRYFEDRPEFEKVESPAELLDFQLLDLDNGRMPGLNWRRFLAHFDLAPSHAQMRRFPSHVMMTQSMDHIDGVALFWHGIHDDLFSTGRFVRAGELSVSSDLGYYLVARDLERKPVADLARFFLDHRQPIASTNEAWFVAS
ncbi:MAG TPA: LysR family transcriptional regulator [Candidatus Aquilonibacter sp.]|nr:LysR family transcriptional regulator [Candidatus Aquilonibacter sp.]